MIEIDRIKRDMREEFHTILFDLTDLTIYNSIRTNNGFDFIEENKDKLYNKCVIVATGHFVNKIITGIDYHWYDNPYPRTSKIVLRLLNPSDKEPRNNGKFSVSNHDHPKLSEFQIVIDIPHSFFARLRDAFIYPERIGRIQIYIAIKLFTRNYDGDLLFDPDNKDIAAYLNDLIITSRPLFPSPRNLKENSLSHDRVPEAVRAINAPSPEFLMNKSIYSALKVCIFLLFFLIVIITYSIWHIFGNL